VQDQSSDEISSFFRKERNPQTILVYDLGGGTFDVSILQIHNKIFKVIKVGGDRHLGGQDFSRAMVDDILNLLQSTPGYKGIPLDEEQLQRLFQDCEEGKKKLSIFHEVVIKIPCALENNATFEQRYTREAFNDANAAAFESTMVHVDTVCHFEF